MLEEVLPDDATLTIAGYHRSAVTLANFPRSLRITYLGEVDDVFTLYNDARFFLAPMRFAAEIPYELYEAAAHGLPIIASDILCEQTGWNVREDILKARGGEAEEFRRSAAQAYDDHVLWARLRGNALARIMMENSQKVCAQRLEKVLAY